MSREHASADVLLADARWLRGLARRLVASADDAEELLQEARLVALTRPGGGRAWTQRVVANLARMRWRSERARAARERAVARPERLDSAAEVVERAEAQRLLVEHVLALDEPYRATILWRFFDGLPAAEIARRAGVPGSTVRTRIERGLAALRARLERERCASWAVLVVPLARRVPVAAGTGAVAMKLGMAAAGVTVLAGVLWWLGTTRARDGNEARASAGVAVADAAAEAEALAAPGSAREAIESASPPPAEVEGELTGRVLTTAGEPVAGARVRALRPLARQWPVGIGESEALDGLAEEVARTTAAEDGAFRLEIAGDTVLDLAATAEGYAPRLVLNLHGGERTDIALGRAARIVGRVTRPSGEPVAGAQVEATQGVIPGVGRTRLHARTDADGRYRFDPLAPGWFHLWIESDVSEPVLLAEGAEHRLDCVLAEPVVLRGVVTDGRTQAPLAGARVWVRLREDDGVRTDAEGRYRIAVRARAMDVETLHAGAPGYGDFERRLSDVPPGGDELDFFLLPGREARGRVVDAEGAPVAGALVNASARASVDGVHRWDGRSTRTDVEGRFRLGDLRVDLRHTLLVRADGHASAAFDFPAEEWSETELDLGDLPLDPPGLLAGRVVDPQGHPVPGVWVFANVEPQERDRLGPLDGGAGYLGGFGERAPQARVDAHGRFLLTNLPAGEVWLKADAKGWTNAGERRVELAPGERRTDLEITIDPGHSVRGTVVDAEGRPLPGITVDACDADGFRIVYDLAREDGSFALHGLPEGAVGIRASSGWGHRGRFAERYLRDVPVDSQDVRLVLERAVEQRVRVADRLGASLAGAYVGLLDEQENVPSLGPADREGRLTLWVPEKSPFAVKAFANRHFDPRADFFDAFFVDEAGNLLPGTSAILRDLVASPDEVVIVVDGLP